MKRVKDLIEFAVDQAVKRFEKSSLHTESIMMHLKDDEEVKKYLDVELKNLDGFIKQKKKSLEREALDQLKEEINLEKSVEITTEPVKVKYKKPKLKNPNIDKGLNHRNLTNLSKHEKDRIISKLYNHRDLSSLSPLEFTVLDIVSSVHNIGMKTILSKYRGIDVVVARTQFLMIMCELFNYTTIAAGVLVIRDHSTVVHAKKSHKDYMEFLRDKNYIETFNRVIEGLHTKYPELFNLDENKIEKIQDTYNKAVSTNRRLASRKIAGIKLVDIITDHLAEKNAETN